MGEWVLAIKLWFTNMLALLLKSTPFYIDSTKQTPVRAPVYYEKKLLFTFLGTQHCVRVHNELKTIYYTLLHNIILCFYIDTANLHCKPSTPTRVPTRASVRGTCLLPCPHILIVLMCITLSWQYENKATLKEVWWIYLLFGAKCNWSLSFTFLI